MWLFLPLAIKAMCDRQGYTKILEKAGVKLLIDTCSVVENLAPKGTKVVATNSAKQAHFLPNMMDVECFYGSTKDCVDATLSGKWKGEF